MIENREAIERWLRAGAPMEMEVKGDLWDASCFYSELLGFCGCGDPVAAATFLGSLLRNIKDEVPGFGIDGLPDGIELLLLYWIDDRGWAEHGGNVCSSWLTDDGKLALRVLEAFVKLEKAEEAEFIAEQGHDGWSEHDRAFYDKMMRTAATHDMAVPREVME